MRNISIMFIIQTPTVFGQWTVTSLYCYPDVGCWDQTVNVPAQVNFRVRSTLLEAATVLGGGYAYTESTCLNGASVQNNA